MILDGDKVLAWLASYKDVLQAQPANQVFSGAIRAVTQVEREILQFQIDLEGPSPHNVRNTDPEEAHEAAGSNTMGRSKNRMKVYAAIQALGAGTPEEIAAKAIEMYPGVYPPYSLARRVTDLAERGVVQKTGEKRRTSAGGMADVWELVP